MAEEKGIFLSSASSFAGATHDKEDSDEQSTVVSFLPVYNTLA